MKFLRIRVALLGLLLALVTINVYAASTEEVGKAVDEPGGAALHQGIRVIAEGGNAGNTAGGIRQNPADLQKRLVAQMHPVKKAQGVDCVLFHKHPICKL